MPFLFRGPNKLVGTQALPPEPSNILAVLPKPPDAPTVTLAGPRALTKVYLNEKMQEIVQIVIEARFAAIKSLCECPLKVCFFEVYRGDN